MGNLATSTDSGSVLEPNLRSINTRLADEIPMLHQGIEFQGTLTVEDMRQEEFMIFFYTEISEIDIYGLTLTLPLEVYYARAEIRTLIINDYDYKQPKTIDYLYFDEVREETISISRYIEILDKDYVETRFLGITLIFRTIKNPERDRTYNVKFFRATPEFKTEFESVLRPEETDITHYHLLDLASLGITVEGYYSFTVRLTVSTNSSSGSATGRSRLYSLQPEDRHYSYSWTMPEDYEMDFYLYLDPDKEYFFRTRDYFYSYSDIEVSISVQFTVRELYTHLLRVNGSLILEESPTLVKIDIPENTGVRITFHQEIPANYHLEVRNSLSVFHSREYYSYLNLDTSASENRFFRISYMELVRSPIDQKLLSYSSLPPETSHIVMGGLVENDEFHRISTSDFDYRSRVSSSPLIIPLLGENDYIHFFFTTDTPLELRTEEFRLNSELSVNDPLDPTSAPLKIFELDTNPGDLFILENDQNLMAEDPLIVNDDDLGYFYSYHSTNLLTTFYFPSNPIFSSGSYSSYFQSVGMRKGKGILVYSSYYEIGSYGGLNTPRDQIISLSEIRLKNAEVIIEKSVTRGKIPVASSIIDLKLNQSSIYWYSFSVARNTIYNISIEAYPFISNINLRIVDITGKNPLSGLNNEINKIGANNILIGKRTINSYLIISGYGRIKIHINHVNPNNSMILPPTTIFGILLLLGIAAILIGKRFFPD
jgi:hypothetical protein